VDGRQALHEKEYRGSRQCLRTVGKGGAGVEALQNKGRDNETLHLSWLQRNARQIWTWETREVVVVFIGKRLAETLEVGERVQQITSPRVKLGAPTAGVH
jgi:hypothetical protein